jgi:hypothetical protein
MEVDNKKVDSNPKVEEGPIVMQKYSSKQEQGLGLLCKLLLQVSSKFRKFHHFPRHLS